ncbi:Uncharacterised protein [Streptococcus pyogenes]|uniref:hypothetical protein n=1 Tax=Streptococcus pyogenes TaxID=1314 RepID=UPI0010A10890|nr:hypothetical protein [Streptococcus pyogenes]VHC87150.1 Uncharacterised protein [Streptococcus pyogenes]
MRTKSKHFLKLATLCLALLGTTLLTTQPVKAEGVQYSLGSGVSSDSSEQSSSTGQTGENAEDDNIKKEYMARVGLDELKEQYDKARFQGYLNGYKEGLKGSNRPEPNDISVPDDFKSNSGDYKDGYEEGFGEGKYKGHPLEALLEDAWRYLTDIFKSWFG